MKAPAALALLASFLAACGGDDIQVYTVPKENPAAMAEAPGPGFPPGPAAAEATAAPAAASSEIHWRPPSSWKEKPAGQMRLASYGVPGPGGEADMSVVVLPGEAGGPLANVNRWRGQLGMEPLADESALAAASRRVKTRAGEAVVVEFHSPGTGPGTAMLAAILSHAGQSWFFKLTGPEATVKQAGAGYLELLGSLHPAE